uniref:WAT1-related protein n=1 Tax=Oryza brachyantha TaxID=4533 RepID=J3M377_ORYBR
MDGKKPYVMAVVIQVIYTGLYVVSKAAFDQGMNTFVFIFYRQAAATLLLLPLAIILERRNAPPMSLRLFTKLFMYALLGNTISMNVYNISLKYTSATVGSATSNSVPVVTFFLAVLLRLEVIRLRTLSGMAKAAGVALCLGGVLVIALYAGPAISPLNHHRAFTNEARRRRRADEVGEGDVPDAAVQHGMVAVDRAPGVAAQGVPQQAARHAPAPNKLLATLLHTGFVVTGVSFYLQAWCIEKKGPVFLAMSNPLCFVLTIFCSSFFLGEIVHLGSILGGILLVAGLYSVLWGKSKEHNMQLTLAAAATVQVKQQQDDSADNKMDIAADEDEKQQKLASPEQQV